MTMEAVLFAFAAYSWLLNGLVDELIETEYPTQYEKFRRIKERYGNGWDMLHMAMNLGENPADLTSREFEVASLAAEGLRNSEIAQRLVVTENTVRAHLRVVFEKLQIDRRSQQFLPAPWQTPGGVCLAMGFSVFEAPKAQLLNRGKALSLKLRTCIPGAIFMV